MTAHSASPSEVRPAGKRRAERVRSGPLRVRFHRTCEGILVDISEVGALVQVPLAQAPDKQVKMHLEWQTETLQLAARVVRSSPRQVELPSATLIRTEYQVGVEFNELPQPTVATLRRTIRGE